MTSVWDAPRPSLTVSRATDGHARIAVPAADLTIDEARTLIEDLTNAITEAAEVEALPGDITGIQWGIKWTREGIKDIPCGAGDLWGLNEHDYAVQVIKGWADITIGVLMVRDIYGTLPGPWREATAEEQASAA
jgi:hypothetical protein